MVESCPYKNLSKKLSFFGYGESRDKEFTKNTTHRTINNNTNNEDKLSVQLSDNDCNINNSSKLSNLKQQDTSKCPYNNSESTTSKVNSDKKCPYSNNKKPKQNGNSDISDDEEEKQGGCPVMNKTNTDPPNKHFSESWELPQYGPFDFMFEMKGLLSIKEWKAKTVKLRSYSRHLLYTLFNQNDEKLNKVREKEFPMIFFIYDDIKNKGNKYYKKGKLKEALEYYCYAYSTLKWLQHKDKKKGCNLITDPSLDPILDEHIEEKCAYLDAPDVEEDSYKACLVFITLNIVNIHIENRHYSEALKLLNEAEEIAGDKIPDIFFRRSQVRAYNKYSSIKELEKSMLDIDQAFKSLEEYNTRNKDNFLSKNNNFEIYTKHKEILKNIIENRNKSNNDKLFHILIHAKNSMKIFKEKNMNKQYCLYYNGKDQIRQFKILNEMKSKYYLAIKFFNETKNYEQLDILYKEIELFLDNYNEYKFFIELDLMNLDPKFVSKLENEHNDIKSLFTDELYLEFVNDYRFRACESIFSNYNYNFELFKYALEKIFEDERKEQEEKELKNEKLRKEKSKNNTTLSKYSFTSFKNYIQSIINIFGLKEKDYFFIISIIIFIATVLGIGYMSYFTIN